MNNRIRTTDLALTVVGTLWTALTLALITSL